MATLGEWRGGATSLLPTTTWAAPNGMFSGTATRNDGSAYSFNATTSTLTLPSTGLANGYLIEAGFEFEDDSNGRHNPQGRFVQSSGTGSFVYAATSGFSRDTSEDRSYVRTWCFIANPSASAEIQFQWRRDSDVPTGGTDQAQIQVTPIPHANVGMYSSTSTACPGGTAPNQVTGWSTVLESDTAAIELASNVVTVKGDNKRYLALGGQYWQGIGNARTQRWHGFRIDGTLDNTARAYSYARNGANADLGEIFSTIVETATTDKTIDQIVFRGEAIGAFPNTGADVDGNTTGSNPAHAWVVLELNDSAKVFRSRSDTQQSLTTAGSRVALQIADTVEFSDSDQFTASGAMGINVATATDVLLGANIGGGYASTSTARHTGYGTFTIDGTDQAFSVAGDYGRGNQGSQDCWGSSYNLLGFVAVADGQDVGLSAGKISTSEAGTVAALGGWVGFWGIDLDTLLPDAPPPDVTAALSAQGVGSDSASFLGSVDVSAAATAQESGSDAFAAAAGVALGASTALQEVGQDSAASNVDVAIAASLSAVGVGPDVFSASLTAEIGVTASLDLIEAGSDLFGATGSVSVSLDAGAAESGDDTISVTSSVAVGGALACIEDGIDTLGSSAQVLVGSALAAAESGADALSASIGIAIGGGAALSESGSDLTSIAGTVTIGTGLSGQEVGEDQIVASIALGSLEAARAAWAGASYNHAAIGLSLRNALIERSANEADIAQSENSVQLGKSANSVVVDQSTSTAP